MPSHTSDSPSLKTDQQHSVQYVLPGWIGAALLRAYQSAKVLVLVGTFAFVNAPSTFGEPLPAAPVTFRFVPANGSVIEQIQTRTIVTESSATRGQKEVREEKSTEDWAFERVDGGYRLTKTLRTWSGVTNGQPVANLAQTLLMDRPIVFHISTQGELMRVTGYEHLIEEAKKTFPPQSHAQLEKQFSPEFLENMEKQTWQERFGRFIGIQIKKGDVLKDSTPVDAKDKRTNAPRMHVVVTFPQVVPKGGALLVTILSFHSTDPRLLTTLQAGDFSNAATKDVKEFLDWNVSDLPLMKIVDEIVMDANTMTILKEELKRVHVIDSPNGIDTQTETMRRDYRVKK